MSARVLASLVKLLGALDPAHVLSSLRLAKHKHLTLTSIVVGSEQNIRSAIGNFSEDLLASGSTIDGRSNADQLREPCARQRADEPSKECRVLGKRHGGEQRSSKEDGVSHVVQA